MGKKAALSNGSVSLRDSRAQAGRAPPSPAARRAAPLALCALPLALAAFALAPAAAATELRIDGDYRLRFADNTNLLLDDQGTQLGQQTWAEQRLRLTPVIVEPDAIEIDAQFDLFSGLFAGQLAPAFQGLGWSGRSQTESLQLSGFDFRALFVQLKLPYGTLKLGQMPSDWGLGLVWNAGNEVETIDFGDQRFGDIVERVLFTNKPFDFLGAHSPLAQHLALRVAGDAVYRDRLASLVVRDGSGLAWGDTAFEFLGGLEYVDGERTRVGLVAQRRFQQFAQDAGNLHQWTFDLYASRLEPIAPLDALLTLELEAAINDGAATHLASLDAPGSVAILQGGGIARARLGVRQWEAEVEAGYASGDANPFDSTSNGFSFNRDSKVSLVLWDEVMLFQTQNAAARLASPALGARPPNGLELLPTEGAVTDALYLKPTLRYRPVWLRGKVRLLAAALWSRAPTPVIDAYQAYIHSAPLNAFGAAAGRNYGVELDGAISWRDRFFTDRLGLELGAQYGVLFPGDVFDKPDGTRMGKAVAAKLRAGVEF